MLQKSQDRGEPAGSGEERILFDRDSTKQKMRATPGAGWKRLFTIAPKADWSRNLLQRDEPALIFDPLFARRQIDFQNSGIGGETEPSPGRRKIDRDVSLPIHRTS